MSQKLSVTIKLSKWLVVTLTIARQQSPSKP